MTPPSPAITVRIVGATDVGLIREHNEDNFTVLNLETGEIDFSQGRELPLPSQGALLVVCDGMGGAAAGEVASHMAVEVIRRELGPKPASDVAPSPAAGGNSAAAASDAPSSADKSTGLKDREKTGDGLSPVPAAAVAKEAAAAEAETAEKSASPPIAAESKTVPTSETPPQAAEKNTAEDPARAEGSQNRPPSETAPATSAAAMSTGTSSAPSELSGPLSEAQLHGLARKLRQAGQRANQEIYEAACADISKAGMGTTLTCLLLLRSHVIVGQVGDSRAYLWRKGRLTQITHDQSLVNQLLESGQITPEQAKLFEHSNVILQALGVQEDVEVVLSSETVRRGDRLMLCSDGLVGVVSDEEIQEVLTHCEHIDEAVRRLIELARAGGGPDNITVIVAQVDGEGAPAAAETELAEYRVLYLDGEKPPERRMWGSEYAFMAQTSGARDVVGSAATAQPISSRLSIISMAAVFALLILGVLGGLLYQPRRPVTPGGSGIGPTPSPQPALPPPVVPSPPTPPTGPSTAAATSGPDAGVGVAAAALDAAAVQPASAANFDAGSQDASAALAHEAGEEDAHPSDAAEPEEATKPGKKRVRSRKKKVTDEPTEAPGATGPATTAPEVMPVPAPVPASQPATPPTTGTTGTSDKPAIEKPGTEKAAPPATDKPAADKPATEKPQAEKPQAEKPVAEKPAAEKPAPEKPAAEKPATNPPPASVP